MHRHIEPVITKCCCWPLGHLSYHRVGELISHHKWVSWRSKITWRNRCVRISVVPLATCRILTIFPTCAGLPSLDGLPWSDYSPGPSPRSRHVAHALMCSCGSFHYSVQNNLPPYVQVVHTGKIKSEGFHRLYPTKMPRFWHISAKDRLY